MRVAATPPKGEEESAAVRNGTHFHGAKENFHSADYLADIGSVWQGLSKEDVGDFPSSRVPLNSQVLVNPSLPVRLFAELIGESSFKEVMPM